MNLHIAPATFNISIYGVTHILENYQLLFQIQKREH